MDTTDPTELLCLFRGGGLICVIEDGLSDGARIPERSMSLEVFTDLSIHVSGAGIQAIAGALVLIPACK